MDPSKKEIKNLMRKHNAARSHMNFLLGHFKSMIPQPGITGVHTIKSDELTRQYLWHLFDFEKSLQNHFITDENVLNFCLDSVLLEEIKITHEKISQLTRDTIKLAENAICDNLGPEDLYRVAFDITTTFGQLCELMKSHIIHEDRLMRLVLADLSTNIHTEPE